MLITKRFVVLAFPKAGSSFVRRTLKTIHGYNALPRKVLRRLHLELDPPLLELMFEQIDLKVPHQEKTRHALYCQIPPAHSHKTVVSTTRYPFDRYVSLYLFGRWKELYAPYSCASAI